MEKNYKQIAKEARLKSLELIYKAQTSHIGSNFSCADFLAVLFEHVDVKKDEVVLSAGWKAAIWYYFLWKKGVISEDELNSFCQHGSPMIGLVEPQNRWGLRCAGGSMGMGLPFAVGLALSKKMKGEEGKVYCVMSDGELAIGTTWESALIAAHHKLDNLVVIIDENGLQAMGKTQDVLKAQRFPFWIDKSIDGHNYKQISESFHLDREKIIDNFWKRKPLIIYAHTIKGKGWKRAEGNNLYHYKQLSKEEYEEAVAELR